MILWAFLIKFIPALFAVFSTTEHAPEISFQKLKVDSVKLKSGEYRIEIISKYIDDSADSSESLALCPLVSEQRLRLYYKNQLTSSRLFHDSTLSLLSASKQRVKVLKTRIVQVGIIKGSAQSFFIINGYGGCSTCSEYISIVNKQGESLFVNFHEGGKTILRKGSLEDVLSRNGIDAKKFRTGDFLKTSIAPKSTVCF
jgi:hypothetical protein